ncbi:hypothetical protein BN1263380110 [Stenotrophomonas maltophilia]|nr:hypothetical protein BN1263380110 [Stenotrophomonas maltophilia]
MDLAEQRVQGSPGGRLLQAIEASVLHDRLGRLHQPAPRGTGECAAQTHPANAERGNVLQAQRCRYTDQQVHRLRPGSGDHRADLLARADARCIQHVCTGLCVGTQALQGVLQIRHANEEVLGAADQQHVATRAVDGCTGSAQALDRLVDRTQRCIGHAAGILDRQCCNAGVDRRGHRLLHRLRRGAEAITEVGIQRQWSRCHHHAQMRQRGLQRNRSVRPPFAPGAAGAGGGQCLEALPLQVAGTAHIPRVGQHEATLRVQLAEKRALLLCVGIGRDHGRAPGRQTCTLARPAATLNDNGAHLHEVMPPAYWTLWMRVPERACLPTRCRHGALHAPGPADPHRRRR